MKIIIIAALTACFASGYYGYGQGRDAEKSWWVDREAQINAENQKKIAGLIAEKKERESKLNETIALIVKKNDKDIRTLENRIAALNDRGLYIDTPDCSGGSLPGSTRSSSEPGSGSGRVRLSDEDARNILRDYVDAQRVVNQYTKLKEICLPLLKVIP